MEPTTIDAAPDAAAGATDAKRRRRIRALMLVVAISLPAQLAFERLIAEPFPAIMMPGFSAIQPDADGYFAVMNVEVEIGYAEGPSRVVPFQKFFAPIRPIHAIALLKGTFRERPPRVLPSDSPIKHWVKRVLMPYRLTRRRVLDEQVFDAELLGWFARHARVFDPSREPIGVKIRWYTDRMRVGAQGVERVRTPDGVFAIDLSGGESGTGGGGGAER